MATNYRNKYKNKSKICVVYVSLAMLMVLFYKGTFTHTVPMLSPIIIILRPIFWVIGGIYGVFLIKKILDLYLDGYSPRARKLAVKFKITPITVAAENFDKKANHYANILKDIEDLIMEEEIKEKC